MALVSILLFYVALASTSVSVDAEGVAEIEANTEDVSNEDEYHRKGKGGKGGVPHSEFLEEGMQTMANVRRTDVEEKVRREGLKFEGESGVESLEESNEQSDSNGKSPTGSRLHSELSESLDTIAEISHDQILTPDLVELYRKKVGINQKIEKAKATISENEEKEANARKLVKQSQQATVLGLLRFGELLQEDDLHTARIAYENWEKNMQALGHLYSISNAKQIQVHDFEKDAVENDRETSEAFRRAERKADEMVKSVDRATHQVSALKTYTDLETPGSPQSTGVSPMLLEEKATKE